MIYLMDILLLVGYIILIITHYICPNAKQTLKHLMIKFIFSPTQAKIY